MARKFLTAIDLAQNELQNPRVHNVPGTTGPPTPVKGQLYFDSTGNVLYWWNGTVWVAAQGGAGVSYGTITQEQTFGATKTDGVSTNVARADHGHGNPTHVDADHSLIHLNALATATASYSMGGFNLTSVATPTVADHAATKQYVDNMSAGLAWKDTVRAATTVNITRSNTQTIDGVAVIAADRVLVKNQTSPQENGIFVVSASNWSRATDADVAAEILSTAVFVSEGSTQADTAWVCTADAPITVDTTPLPFVQFAGGGAVTAGAGMTQSGNVLNVIGDSTVTVGADVLGVADNGVANTKLTDMAANTFKGNNTGASADPKDLTVNQAMNMFVGFLSRVLYQSTHAAATTVDVVHNFATRNVQTQVYRNTTPWDTIECDMERPDANTVRFRFAVAPAANEFTFVVMG